ncbi:hypothetical protein EDC04DRAFT_2191402 [Pisolithus marmoratus]|nr:hypothetical protein EDC04DRAFT_2191402 [Pisolithus marmoratus]
MWCGKETLSAIFLTMFLAIRVILDLTGNRASFLTSISFQPEVAQLSRRIPLVCLEARAWGNGATSGGFWFSTIDKRRSVHQECVEDILVVDRGARDEWSSCAVKQPKVVHNYRSTFALCAQCDASQHHTYHYIYITQTLRRTPVSSTILPHFY